MKIKAVFGGVLLVLFSTFFVSAANAGPCSVEDPCETYAVIEGDKVVNIIICQPSECGSGYLHGMKVVPQVKANPTNGLNQGGFMGATLNNDGSFTLPAQYNSEPKIEIAHDDVNNVDISVSMPNGSAKIIKYEDTSVGPQPTLIPSTMPVETTIEISAGDETMVFNERISQEEFDWDVWLSEFQLLFLNLSFFDMILSSWGWFL
jgi:hypothetical protein